MSNLKHKSVSGPTIIDLSAQKKAHKFLSDKIMSDPRFYTEIAAEARVSVSTVRNMAMGNTKSAHARTFQRIGKVYGYTLSLWR